MYAANFSILSLDMIPIFLQILKVIAKLDRELFRCQLLYEIFFSHPLQVYIILGLKLNGPYSKNLEFFPKQIS